VKNALKRQGLVERLGPNPFYASANEAVDAMTGHVTPG
jgi:hypothetical protein